MVPVESMEPATASFKEQVEPKPSLLSNWREFATNATLHGLRYVVQSSLPSHRRMVWALLLFAAASAYFYNSTTSVKKYFSRPIKTEILQETPRDGLKFPAVTICNLNQFMKTKIDTTDEDDNFEKLGLNISGCSETRSVRGNLTCGQALLCTFNDFGSLLVDNCNFPTRQRILSVLNHTKRIFDKKEFLAKYGHDLFGVQSMSGRTNHCVFEDKEQIKCLEEHFIPIVTNSGICYTFNSGYNGSAKSELFRSLYEGSDLGLAIALDVQTNESTFSSSSSGLAVIVHDQNTFVNYHNALKVQPGTHASVVVKLTQYKRLPAPFRTNCSEVDSLAGIKSYTKDGCIYQCRSNHSMDKCGCREDCALPDLRGLPMCSFQDRPCLQKAKREFNLTECGCNNACEQTVYEPRVSYSKFPDNTLLRIIGHSFNYSKEYLSENFVYLQVGFQYLSYEKREEVPSYGMETLLDSPEDGCKYNRTLSPLQGEVGGNMGLFLGCSFLTICEFLDFLWELLLSKGRPRPVAVNTAPA